jgi:hypothetical protein
MDYMLTSREDMVPMSTLILALTPELLRPCLATPVLVWRLGLRNRLIVVSTVELWFHKHRKYSTSLEVCG